MIVLLALACTDADPKKDRPVGDSAAPGAVVLDWVDAPIAVRPPDVWFARALHLETTVPAAITVALSGGDTNLEWAFDAADGPRELPLIGLLPDTTFSGTVTATAGDAVTTADLEITTASRPDDYPLLEPLVHHPDRMSPGWTFLPFDGVGWSKYFVLLDEHLRPRWMWVPPNPVTEGRLIDGTLWWIGGGAIQGHSLLGEREARYSWWENSTGSILVDGVRAFHHEAFPLDDGFLTLSSKLHDIPDYPTRDLTGARPATIASTTIVDLAADGTVRAQVDLADVLDTRRVSWTSFDLLLREDGDVLDWSHGNGVIPAPDDTWIVSLRHQDCLVKVDRTGTIHWILGTPAGWREPWSAALLEPVGDLDWPFHPHAPELLDDGGLLVFDNHNYGSTPYDPPVDRPPPQRSRVVIYDVDEDAGTVTQRWEHKLLSNGEMFAFALGDADMLANGDVLGVWGWIESELDVSYESMGRGLRGARIVEIDPSDPDDPLVLDLRMTSEDAVAMAPGWAAYRAQRVEHPHPALVRW